MRTRHLEFLVEEPSMEAFLSGLLPRMLPDDRTFEIHSFQGKQDLLQKLETRLRSSAKWLPDTWRVVVVVDRDDDDCRELKQKMEHFAERAGLRSRSRWPSCWQLVNRIVIEELEAWYFGDWDAVRAAYPKVSKNVPNKVRYHDPDAVAGGTWEALEKILQKGGYFKGGLAKMEVAQTLGQRLDPYRCKSRSFACFRGAVLEALQSPGDCP